MRQIAVINQKGGVGKTTTTANLAVALVEQGCRVLLIDLDPQAHLTLHVGHDVGDEQPTVLDLLLEEQTVDNVVVPLREGLSLIPAHTYLATAETLLAQASEKEWRLRKALQPLDGTYDILLIDCPPSLGVLTVNALAVATEVLIPLQPHFFGLQGLGKLLETVLLVRDRLNPSLIVDGVVICMHEPQTKLATEVVDDLFRFFDQARNTTLPWATACVYRNYIRRNIKLAEASSHGQTIFDYAPKSNGAIDYEELAKELLRRPAEREAFLKQFSDNESGTDAASQVGHSQVA